MRMSLVTCGCGAFAIAISGSACAQEFQVFDHDLGKVEVTSDQGPGVHPTAFYLGKPDGEPDHIDRSFKEALYGGEGLGNVLKQLTSMDEELTNEVAEGLVLIGP